MARAYNVKFVVDGDVTPETLHEWLCKTIFEDDTDAQACLEDATYDIKVPERTPMSHQDIVDCAETDSKAAAADIKV
jgi:hypothetical protein